MDITIDRFVESLRAHLTRYQPTEGFELVDVRADADHVAVTFRWRKDPSDYRVRVDPGYLGPYAAGPGAAVDEILQGWADDVQLWLMEELDTGFMARAERSREGEVVVLTESMPVRGDADDIDADDFYVTDVPQFAPEVRLPCRVRLRLAPRLALARLRGRPVTFGWTAWAPPDELPGDGVDDGWDLTEVGLDAAAVRAIRDEGRLMGWLKVLEDSMGGGAVAHCAIVRTDDLRVARVAVLESVRAAPLTVRERLIDAAVRLAADEGARTLLVPTDDGRHRRIDTAGC